MKKRFSEEQIAFALRQAQGGTPVTEVCRKKGVAGNCCPLFQRHILAAGNNRIKRIILPKIGICIPNTASSYIQKRFTYEKQSDAIEIPRGPWSGNCFMSFPINFPLPERGKSLYLNNVNGNKHQSGGTF